MAYIHTRCRNMVIEFEDVSEPEYKVEDTTKGLAVEMSNEYVVGDVEANPLYQYFKESEKPTETLSFKKIGDLLGHPLSDLALNRSFWLEDADERLCQCWLANKYYVKRISTEKRKQVVFHKFKFTTETERVKLPDILIHGEVPMRMKYEIESVRGLYSSIMGWRGSERT